MGNKEIINKLEIFFDHEQPNAHEYIWELDLSDKTKERLKKTLILHRNSAIVELFGGEE